jgi:hypothetical protein
MEPPMSITFHSLKKVRRSLWDKQIFVNFVLKYNNEDYRMTWDLNNIIKFRRDQFVDQSQTDMVTRAFSVNGPPNVAGTFYLDKMIELHLHYKDIDWNYSNPKVTRRLRLHGNRIFEFYQSLSLLLAELNYQYMQKCHEKYNTGHLKV